MVIRGESSDGNDFGYMYELCLHGTCQLTIYITVI